MYVFPFLVALLLRGLPELVITAYPIGYETITYYAPPIFQFPEQNVVDVMVEHFKGGPLFYGLTYLIEAVTGGHPYAILKVLGPLLYATMVFSFMVFLKKGMKFSNKLTLTASLLLVFQLAALRISWDRFRNLLALSFLFGAMTALKNDSRYKWPLASGLAVLTVLSRDYVVVMLFAAWIGAILVKRCIQAIVALLPAVCLFAFSVNQNRFFWNYLANDGFPPATSTGYFGVLVDVIAIFAICYLPLLPFVVKGFFRDTLLDPILWGLLIGSFSVVVVPFIAVSGYQRWMMLLVFPFVIYAAKGLENLHLFSSKNLQKLGCVFLAFSVIAAGYASGAFSYVWFVGNSWVPPDLVRSSIEWDEVDEVKGVLSWLDENAVLNSSLIVEERFLGWTLIYMDRAHTDVEVVAYGAGSSPTSTLRAVQEEGFNAYYLIWFADSIPEGFNQIYQQEDLSVFEYR